MTSVESNIIQPNNAGKEFLKVYSTPISNDNNLIGLTNPLNVVNEELFFRISKGLVPGHSAVRVTGIGTNIGQDVTTDLWDLSGTVNNINFLSSATTVYVSSTSAADTANQLVVVGLDANYDDQIQFVTPTGQSQVAVPGTWTRIFNVANISSTSSQGDIYVAESDTLTGGVPDTSTKILAKMVQGNERTFSGTYTVPRNNTLFFYQFTIFLNRGIDVFIRTQSRNQGGVFVNGSNFANFEGFIDIKFVEPSTVLEYADIKNNITSQNAGANLTISARFILVDNDYLT